MMKLFQQNSCFKEVHSGFDGQTPSQIYAFKCRVKSYSSNRFGELHLFLFVKMLLTVMLKVTTQTRAVRARRAKGGLANLTF